MKKLIVAGVMALSFWEPVLKQRSGISALDEVIAAIPETDKTNQELEEYNQSLGKQYDDLQRSQ